MKWIKHIFIVATFMLSGAPSFAASLLVNDDGLLTGATSVLVGDTYYDVKFKEGSCDSLLAGCDPFLFFSVGTRVTAGRALLDQVFIGRFDDSPQLTFGCESSIVCNVIIPWAGVPVPDGQVNVDYVKNWGIDPDSHTGFDYIDGQTIAASYDTATAYNAVYALWRVSDSVPVNVPEPSSITLLIAGLVGLAVGRKKSALMHFFRR